MKFCTQQAANHAKHGAQAPERLASFHTYYNQGPWDVSATWRLDDWSNTWLGLHYMANGHDLKYGVFDPLGKQSGFAHPYMYLLFDLAQVRTPTLP